MGPEKPVVVEVEPILVTRDMAAQILSLSVAEIDNLRRAGRIVARRHGRKILFTVDELRRFASSLPADDLQ